MSKYGVISGPYFPVFGLNTGKYGPEKTPYLDTFHAVYVLGIVSKFLFHFKTSLSVIKPVNFYSSKHLVATSMYFHQIMQPLTRGFRLLTILEKKNPPYFFCNVLNKPMLNFIFQIILSQQIFQNIYSSSDFGQNPVSLKKI